MVAAEAANPMATSFALLTAMEGKKVEVFVAMSSPPTFPWSARATALSVLVSSWNQ